ncbi:MAG: hypothetical protein C4527_26185 [Candidatus Omnitrophota bacterium]|jgi:hypothetical protein|nr:MAG: hypothetical protein C4527_26185 [Candidatus Omnitrophota bacterium]
MEKRCEKRKKFPPHFQRFTWNEETPLPQQTIFKKFLKNIPQRGRRGKPAGNAPGNVLGMDSSALKGWKNGWEPACYFALSGLV